MNMHEQASVETTSGLFLEAMSLRRRKPKSRGAASGSGAAAKPPKAAQVTAATAAAQTPAQGAPSAGSQTTLHAAKLTNETQPAATLLM